MRFITALDNLENTISELEAISDHSIQNEFKELRADEEAQRLLLLFRKSLHALKFDLECLSANLDPFFDDYVYKQNIK